jgi:hypothetical protein
MKPSNPGLELVGACFEKCGLGFGVAPKPLSAIILCEGLNYKDMKKGRTACPVIVSFFKRKNEKMLEEAYLSMVKNPDHGRNQIFSFFGKTIEEYSTSLEKAIQKRDFSHVDVSYALSFVLARHGVKVPYVVPVHTHHGERAVLVCEKGNHCFVIATSPDSTKETERMLEEFNGYLAHPKYKDVHRFLHEKDTMYLSVTLLHLQTPVRKGLTYQMEAWVIPYLLSKGDPRNFLEHVAGENLHEFLESAHGYKAPKNIK